MKLKFIRLEVKSPGVYSAIFHADVKESEIAKLGELEVFK